MTCIFKQEETTMPKDDDLNNPVADYQRKIMLERSAQSRIEFEKMGLAMVRTIPEAIFKAHFLPFFAGDKVDNVKELLTIWNNVAGSNFLPVNVVDGSGKVVVQVPPLQENSYFAPLLKRNVDLDYSMKVAREKSTISPTLGTNIIYDELMARFEVMTENANGLEAQSKWIQMLAHYGRAPVNAAVPGKKVNDDDDLYEY
jgi:hypothetical protein